MRPLILAAVVVIALLIVFVRAQDSTDTLTEDEAVLVSLNPHLPIVPTSQHGRSRPMSAAKHWLDALTQQQAILGGALAEGDRFFNEFTIANMQATRASANALLDAFLRAYNEHSTVIVAPDDLWLLIQIKLSDFIKKNPTQTRGLFVESDKRQTIALEEPRGKSEPEWKGFLIQMAQQLIKNAKPGLAAELMGDFSTTHEVEAILTSAALMTTFQPFFSYQRMVPSSGVRNVMLVGRDSDWVRLTRKTAALRRIMRNTAFADEYLASIVPIFDEFLATYRREPNAEFWAGIFRSDGETNQISGWFLSLFGLNPEKPIDPNDVKLPALQVPISLYNSATNRESTCYVVGGFNGVRYDSASQSYRPVQSLSVLVDTTTIKSLDVPSDEPQPVEPRTTLDDMAVAEFLQSPSQASWSWWLPQSRWYKERDL